MKEYRNIKEFMNVKKYMKEYEHEGEDGVVYFKLRWIARFPLTQAHVSESLSATQAVTLNSLSGFFQVDWVI